MTDEWMNGMGRDELVCRITGNSSNQGKWRGQVKQSRAGAHAINK